MFIACELVAGLLVLIPRTSRIGYPVYLIAANVAVLDWSFGLAPLATWLATFLVAGSAYSCKSAAPTYVWSSATSLSALCGAGSPEGLPLPAGAWC
jgi:hypothetical protein